MLGFLRRRAILVSVGQKFVDNNVDAPANDQSVLIYDTLVDACPRRYIVLLSISVVKRTRAIFRMQKGEKAQRVGNCSVLP